MDAVTVPDLRTRLKAALSVGEDDVLGAALTCEQAADVAEVLPLFSDEDRSRIIYALPARTAAELIVMLPESVRGDVVDDLDGGKITEIVSELPPDDATDVVSELDDARTRQVLQTIEPAKSDQIEALLRHDEDSAGGIMTTDVVKLPQDATVRDAVHHVRTYSPSEDLHEVFIVDAEGRLSGSVELRHLVTSPRDARLSDLADPRPHVVTVDTDQEEVLQQMRKYDLPDIPVVNHRGQLVGLITHDDILDVAGEEATEDLYRMAGTDPAERETSSVFRAAGVRLPWIMGCMAVTTVTGLVMAWQKSHFSLTVYTALSFFVPMIAATCGSSAIQISTVVIRRFAEGDVSRGGLIRVLRRELPIASLIAIAAAVVSAGLVAFFLPLMIHRLDPGLGAVIDPHRIASAVGAGMASAILVAASLGIGLPFLFRSLGFDPAIASGPVVTGLNDVTSVLVYLCLASLIMAN
ncbi:MAG: magnesium transporter [Phycisphaerales bacterium]|nr:MAG: magnesium transporter [Phycisphaerales bacterium]